jgi:hypothetical protein
MMPTRTRRRSAWLGLAVLLGTTFLLASAATLHAQVLSDPRTAEFDPSPDHWALLGSGQPAVLKYELDVYLVGASTPLGTVDMGKPSPDADGKIRYDFSAQIASLVLPGSNYEARVSAVGPEGEALSEPSNPFTFTSFHSCAVFLNPETVNAAAGGGRYATIVTTGADCAWSAVAGAPWLRGLTGGGPGNGRVEFDADANMSTSGRSGFITIGDMNLVVNQDAAAPPPCTYSLSPTFASVGASGGTMSFGVTTSSGCSWTATTSSSWIAITSTANGAVNLNVAANTATSSRTGTVTVQGQTFTVTQAAAPAPCSYSLSPGSASAPAEGGSVSFTVSTDGNCSWTAAPTQAWLSVNNGVGTGTRTVTVNVSANASSSARAGSVTVEGRNFTVNQAAPPAPPECSYSVMDSSFGFTAEGGQATVAVKAGPGCPWNVSSDQVWLVPGVSGGSGDGSVPFVVRPTNAAATKTARLTVGPWVVTVTQEGKLRRVK